MEIINFLKWGWWLLIPPMATDPGSEEEILGIWLREDKQNYQVQIYRRNDQYFGKIIWMKEALDADSSPRKDSKNPNPDLRDRPLLGMDVLRNFTYDRDGKWQDGFVYSFNRGKEYRASIEMKDQKLKLTASFWFLSRTYYWIRSERLE